MGIARQKGYPMTYLVIALIIAGWLLCSVIAYAGTFAYWQREFPILGSIQKKDNQVFSAILGFVGGPITLVATFIATGGYKHGFLFW